MLRTQGRLSIVVLEDNFGRRAAMEEATGDLGQLHFFGGVPEFAEFVRTHSSEIDVISLDHDLVLPQSEVRMLTPEEREISTSLGDGVLACEQLLEIYADSPVPPIIVHTANEGRRYRMLATLGVNAPDDLPNGGLVASRDGRLNVTIVFPYNDLAWVSRDWGPALRALCQPANEDS